MNVSRVTMNGPHCEQSAIEPLLPSTPTATPVTVMTPEDARTLTARINEAAGLLWQLLLEAYEKQAWKALGYSSFREYARAEFRMGQSYAYRLLDQGRVIRQIEQAAGISPMGEIISEREARALKPHLPGVLTQIEEAVEDGETPKIAIDSALAVARARAARPPDMTYFLTRKRDATSISNRFVARMAEEVSAIMAGTTELVDFQLLDTTCTEEWARTIREGGEALIAFAAKLEKADARRRGDSPSSIEREVVV